MRVNLFIISFDKMATLPYCRNVSEQKPQKQTKISYGILCISRDGYIVMNKSPCYIKTKLEYFKGGRNLHRNNFGYVMLNSNEKYSLDMGLFPNATLEGEYTLPKGHMESIDNDNYIFTKLREFIEETKYTHPIFYTLFENHYESKKFKSFLNDENFIIREKWMGLNNKIYESEYSVFIIDSINELKQIRKTNNIVPFKHFLKYSIYSKCFQYYDRYMKSCRLDRYKTTEFLPIERGIQLLNQHKLKEYKSITMNDILKYL